jgi:riboflavin kinase
MGVKPSHLQMLKRLALLGALESRISVSSAELGASLGMSQQSAARILRELRDGGYVDIDRGRRSWVIITGGGRAELMKEYADYRAIFESSEPVIRGKVVSGLGEGRYYLSKEGYVRQIEEMFGFKPYPGTLNIRLEQEEIARFLGFMNNAVTIKGFTSEGRSFGDVPALKASIMGMECAIINPERSHYSDVVEVIAPVMLRDALGLSDGDSVKILLR